MKRSTQWIKVIILTFCLILILLNVHQIVQAQTIWTMCAEAQHQCQRLADWDCDDICDRLPDSEPCDTAEFSYGYCYTSLCMQWYDIYCDPSGWQDTITYECGFGCEM